MRRLLHKEKNYLRIVKISRAGIVKEDCDGIREKRCVALTNGAESTSSGLRATPFFFVVWLCVYDDLSVSGYKLKLVIRFSTIIEARSGNTVR